MAWLGIVNGLRRANKLSPLTVDSFEFAIDRFEKESFAASLDPQHDGKTTASNTGHCSPCAVCAATNADSTNLLLVCDACSLTVHQVCLCSLHSSLLFARKHMFILLSLCAVGVIINTVEKKILTKVTNVLYLPPTSTWPHLNSDVGLEEGEY